MRSQRLSPDLTPFSATSIPSTASTQGLVLTSSHFTTCWLMSLIVSRRHVPFPQDYVLFFSCTQTPTANREAYSYTHIRFKIGGSVQQGRSPCGMGGTLPGAGQGARDEGRWLGKQCWFIPDFVFPGGEARASSEPQCNLNEIPALRHLRSHQLLPRWATLGWFCEELAGSAPKRSHLFSIDCL